mgnify:CR=1 FL=1
MGLLNIIRRMHLREKLSIREIARRTGLSRNTVTKHLAANTIEPKFATPDRPSKLDPFSCDVFLVQFRLTVFPSGRRGDAVQAIHPRLLPEIAWSTLFRRDLSILGRARETAHPPAELDCG